MFPPLLMRRECGRNLFWLARTALRVTMTSLLREQASAVVEPSVHRLPPTVGFSHEAEELCSFREGSGRGAGRRCGNDHAICHLSRNKLDRFDTLDEVSVRRKTSFDCHWCTRCSVSRGFFFASAREVSLVPSIVAGVGCLKVCFQHSIASFGY